MEPATRLIAVLITSFTVAACAETGGGGSTGSGSSESVTITGSYAYREKIALRPGATGIVTLRNVSRADASAPLLAEQMRSLDGQSPPFVYELSVPAADLDPRMRYAVRAEIRSVDDDLLWTTDQTHLIDPEAGDQAVDEIVLVRVGFDGGVSANDSLTGEWSVEAIDGQGLPSNVKTSVRFGSDGVVSGLAGCNRFTGSFGSPSDGRLTINPLALTRRACIPPHDKLEAEFMGVMQNVTGYEFRRDAVLFLSTEDGQSLTARRL